MEEKKSIELLVIVPFIFLFALGAFLVDDGRWIKEFLALPLNTIFLYSGIGLLVLLIIGFWVALSLVKPG